MTNKMLPLFIWATARMRGRVAIHRPNHAEVVCELRRVGEQAADLKPALAVLAKTKWRLHEVPDRPAIRAHLRVAYIRFSMESGQGWLRIKSVDLARTAIHEKENGMSCPRLKMRRLGAQ